MSDLSLYKESQKKSRGVKKDKIKIERFRILKTWKIFNLNLILIMLSGFTITIHGQPIDMFN